MNNLIKKIADDQKKHAPFIIENAINIILELGQYDGSHHKQYALDQTLRALTGGCMLDDDVSKTPEYEKLVAEYKNGEDGPNTYSYDEGIAP